MLYWYEDSKATKLPKPLEGKALLAFVFRWLKKAWQERAAGDEPDHDGDNSVGFRVFNEDWGHVAGDHSAFVGIQPVWAMHGK